MANMCENVLVVSGDYSELMRFDETFRGGRENVEANYHFDNLYPSPQLSISDMCDWCKKHWGVKGNFYECTFNRDKVSPNFKDVNYYFDTPNSGPTLLIEKVAKDFSKLSFMLAFRELGNDIRQVQRYESGTLVSDERMSNEDMVYWFGDDKDNEEIA